MRQTTIACSLLALAAFAGCGGDSEPSGKDGANKEKGEVAAGTEAASAKPDPGPAPTATEADPDETGTEKPTPPPAEVVIEPIGIAECDNYIEKFSACVEAHAPEAEREEHRAALREQVGAWKQTKAGNAEVAATALPIGCKTALEGAKAATKSWKCAW